ncbi:MAG TPA: Ig-like domain-containing protein [Rubrobacter sp.]|nr:Ig-like domain-containing protein [Rubrobacter sp.]
MDLRLGDPATKTVAPMRVDSQEVVTNLNADKLDGKSETGFYAAGSKVADSSHADVAGSAAKEADHAGAADLAGKADSFTYRVTDGTLASGDAAVDIQVHDATAPTVVGKRPKGMKISPNARVRATFSEKGESTPVGATVVAVENAAGDTVAILSPNRALRPGATYTATVTTDAADLEGNALAYDTSWRFTVKSRR